MPQLNAAASAAARRGRSAVADPPTAAPRACVGCNPPSVLCLKSSPFELARLAVVEPPPRPSSCRSCGSPRLHRRQAASGAAVRLCWALLSRRGHLYLASPTRTRFHGCFHWTRHNPPSHRLRVVLSPTSVRVAPPSTRVQLESPSCLKPIGLAFPKCALPWGFSPPPKVHRQILSFRRKPELLPFQVTGLHSESESPL